MYPCENSVLHASMTSLTQSNIGPTIGVSFGPNYFILVCSTNRRLGQSSGNKFENSPWPHMNMHISLLYSIHKTVGEKHLNDDLLLAILKYTTKKWTVYYRSSTGMSRLLHTICIHTIQYFVDRCKVISYSKITCLKSMQF